MPSATITVFASILRQPFNNSIEPENVRAAQQVLEAAGYTVHVNTRARERPLCYGRTLSDSEVG
ncbi:hypothetical protein J8I87_24095 [Paraburkholderia sp. LEh10]|uniref:hypothetical protein n=1 Tax=Paraburkholderia sp. LEh10 TaxID=2821353 RepID=UPI001AE13007|nr:hypothetical protein [Paraburkholderia sp. LEh10]MBP0592758.1 hypothetical protein [Paraburkholderia sp. LEh10]